MPKFQYIGDPDTKFDDELPVSMHINCGPAVLKIFGAKFIKGGEPVEFPADSKFLVKLRGNRHFREVVDVLEVAETQNGDVGHNEAQDSSTPAPRRSRSGRVSDL